MKSGFLSDGTYISSEENSADYDIFTKRLQESSIVQRGFAYFAVGPIIAHRLRVVLVEADDSSYWFAQVFLQSHLSTRSAQRDTQEFDLGQYLDLTPPTDWVGRILNCICP